MRDPTDTGRSGPPRLGLALLGALVAVGLVAAVVLALAGGDESGARPPGLRGDALPEGLAGAPAPRIRLPAARGGAVDSADLVGRPYAVTFLYTRCPDVCPLIAQEIRAALEALGPDARRATVLAVSVDPAGDTREAVRDWLDRHRLHGELRYLIGTREQLEPVWEGYFAAPQTPGRPESAHTASIWLVDARGRLRAVHSAGRPLDPADLAHDLRVLLAEA